MLALKEKVSEKLSRLLGDSPSPVASQPPDHPQLNSFPKGPKTLSSFFTFIHPSTPVSKTEDDCKPMQSSLGRWRRSQSCSWRGINLDDELECIPKEEPIESSSPLNEHESPVTPGGTYGPEIFDDVIEPQSPWKHMPNLTTDSSFIDIELYDFLQSSIPNIVKGCQWVLLYSTLKHGISLRTLIRKSADLPGPGILIVGDKKGAVFGGLIDCPLTPSPKRKYQGTNQTFVFTTIYGEPRLFRTTGINRYFYLCLNDLLAFGGGVNFALSLDEDLLTGSSGPCDTFGNACLAFDPEFELKNVEISGAFITVHKSVNGSRISKAQVKTQQKLANSIRSVNLAKDSHKSYTRHIFVPELSFGVLPIPLAIYPDLIDDLSQLRSVNSSHHVVHPLP